MISRMHSDIRIKEENQMVDYDACDVIVERAQIQHYRQQISAIHFDEII